MEQRRCNFNGYPAADRVPLNFNLSAPQKLHTDVLTRDGRTVNQPYSQDPFIPDSTLQNRQLRDHSVTIDFYQNDFVAQRDGSKKPSRTPSFQRIIGRNSSRGPSVLETELRRPSENSRKPSRESSLAWVGNEGFSREPSVIRDSNQLLPPERNSSQRPLPVPTLHDFDHRLSREADKNAHPAPSGFGIAQDGRIVSMNGVAQSTLRRNQDIVLKGNHDNTFDASRLRTDILHHHENAHGTYGITALNLQAIPSQSRERGGSLPPPPQLGAPNGRMATSQCPENDAPLGTGRARSIPPDTMLYPSSNTWIPEEVSEGLKKKGPASKIERLGNKDQKKGDNKSSEKTTIRVRVLTQDGRTITMKKKVKVGEEEKAIQQMRMERDLKNDIEFTTEVFQSDKKKKKKDGNKNDDNNIRSQPVNFRLMSEMENQSNQQSHSVDPMISKKYGYGKSTENYHTGSLEQQSHTESKKSTKKKTHDAGRKAPIDDPPIVAHTRPHRSRSWDSLSATTFDPAVTLGSSKPNGVQRRHSIDSEYTHTRRPKKKIDLENHVMSILNQIQNQHMIIDPKRNHNRCYISLPKMRKIFILMNTLTNLLNHIKDQRN